MVEGIQEIEGQFLRHINSDSLGMMPCPEQRALETSQNHRMLEWEGIPPLLVRTLIMKLLLWGSSDTQVTLLANCSVTFCSHQSLGTLSFSCSGAGHGQCPVSLDFLEGMGDLNSHNSNWKKEQLQGQRRWGCIQSQLPPSWNRLGSLLNLSASVSPSQKRILYHLYEL